MKGFFSAVVMLMGFDAFAQKLPNINFAEELTKISLGPTFNYCPPTPKKKVSYALSASYKNNGADCSKFINAKGQLGEHGNTIFTHLDKITNSMYLKNSYPGMTSTCPKWQSFTRDEKKYFWVWFFAALSWKEATCQESEINKNATSGVAVGYLQLNEKQADRKWRGDDSGKSCAATEVKSATYNLKCGLEIFNEQLRGKDSIYLGNGQLAGKGSNSYWQDLRGSNSKVLKMVQDFPGCK